MAHPNTVLITGILGQDAAYLAQIALAAGHRVVGGARVAALADPARFWRLEHLGLRHDITCVPFDLGNSENVAQVVAVHRPALIFNLAAQSSIARSLQQPLETLDTTLMGAARLFEAQRLGAPHSRLFQPSSTESFRGGSSYALAKSAAHDIACFYRQAYGLHICNALLGNHESPLRDATFVSRKIVKSLVDIQAGRLDTMAIGNLDSLRNWSHARDVMEAAWQILQREQPGDFLLPQGTPCTIRDFIQTCAQQLGMDLTWQGSGLSEQGLLRPDGRPVIRVDPAFYRPTEAPLPQATFTAKFKETLNAQPRYSLQTMIREMIDHELAISKGR